MVGREGWWVRACVRACVVRGVVDEGLKRDGGVVSVACGLC